MIIRKRRGRKEREEVGKRGKEKLYKINYLIILINKYRLMQFRPLKKKNIILQFNFQPSLTRIQPFLSRNRFHQEFTIATVVTTIIMTITISIKNSQ